VENNVNSRGAKHEDAQENGNAVASPSALLPPRSNHHTELKTWSAMCH